MLTRTSPSDNACLFKSEKETSYFLALAFHRSVVSTCMEIFLVRENCRYRNRNRITNNFTLYISTINFLIIRVMNFICIIEFIDKRTDGKFFFSAISQFLPQHFLLSRKKISEKIIFTSTRNPFSRRRKLLPLIVIILHNFILSITNFLAIIREFCVELY